MKTIRNSAAQQPFFKELPNEFASLVNGCAKTVRFSRGETIFSKGLPAGKFYLIVSGEIALETPYIPGDGLVTLRTLTAGEPLGWSWFYPPYEWHFAARATAASELIELDAAALRSAAEHDARFGYWLSRRIGMVLLDRLQDTRMSLLEACEASVQPC